jgi:hypothetical protein
VTQLAAHTRVATFIGLILFHGPFASILVPRFVYGNNLNALDHTMSQFFMCHCILSDQATQIIGPNTPSRILPFATNHASDYRNHSGSCPDWSLSGPKVVTLKPASAGTTSTAKKHSPFFGY